MPCLSRVYPRVYGGTIVRHVEKRPSLGLSPRLRGNRKLRPPILLRHGSIPACTGEPRDRGIPASAYAVYPRVYGGTCLAEESLFEREGLSPRVRGNLPSPLSLLFRFGSIPACTGEPFTNPNGGTSQ